MNRLLAFTVIAGSLALAMPARAFADQLHPVPGDRFTTWSDTIVCLTKVQIDRVKDLSSGPTWQLDLAQFLARTPQCVYTAPNHEVMVIAVPKDDPDVARVVLSEPRQQAGAVAGLWVNVGDLSFVDGPTAKPKTDFGPGDAFEPGDIISECNGEAPVCHDDPSKPLPFCPADKAARDTMVLGGYSCMIPPKSKK